MLCECEGTKICQKCKGRRIVGGLVCDKCNGTGKCVCKRNEREKQKKGSCGWFVATQE